MIACVGGSLGVLLSRWGLQTLLYFAPKDFPRLSEVTLDLRVLAIAGESRSRKTPEAYAHSGSRMDSTKIGSRCLVLKTR